MKKIIIISIISCTLTGAVWAQSSDDAMLFSRNYSGGTARSVGMSGAFGAIGGDLSVLSTNPAGLAVYRGSEFTFTPGLVFTSTNAKYDGTFNDKNTHFIINNIGYVYTKNLYNEKGLQSVNFGISYNRLSDFYSDTYVRKAKATTSMLDEFVYYGNGLDDGLGYRPSEELSAFYEGLAWGTYAINFDDTKQEYFSEYNNRGYGQPLYRSMSTRGGVGEYDFSIGLNINHTIFWGATLGFQDIYFRDYYYHEENPGFEHMRYFNFSDEYSVNGVGLNFKTGIIYRPFQMLRLGAAIHTPTYIWMRPYQWTGMSTSWNTLPAEDESNPIYLDAESDPSEKYRLSTPWRYHISAATVLGTIGVIDVDMEIVDYSSCHIFPKSIYDIENGDISKYLKTAVNVKGGAEIRLGPLYLRGGIAYYGNPYAVRDDYSTEYKNTLKSTMSYSGGIGFRARSFYMDVAYLFMKQPERFNKLYMTYNDTRGAWEEQVKLQTKSNKLLVTFGFRL